MPPDRIVAAMANGKRLTLNRKAGKEVAHASLSGSAAALRFIDAEQRRAGTVTAAVAKGTKPANTVPPVAALPKCLRIAPSGVAAKVTPALIKTMRSLSGCETEDVQSSDPITGNAIGGGKTLILLPCGARGPNFSTVPFVVTAGKPVIARFDLASGVDGGRGYADSGQCRLGREARAARQLHQGAGPGRLRVERDLCLGRDDVPG